MPSKIESSEGIQSSFDPMPKGPVVSKKSELSPEQRIAIAVDALKSGQNLPLKSIINGIKSNRSEGGTDTTLLRYKRADGTIGHIEATLGELETIQELRRNATRSKAPRRRRLKGL